MEYENNDELNKAFILTNENPSLTIESLNRKKLLSYDVNQLIEICNHKTKQILKDMPFERRIYCYSFEINFGINKVDITIDYC